MTAYDDLPTSCTHCSIGLETDTLCECDDDPCCVRCHRINHVETSWMDRRDDIGDEVMRRAMTNWGQGGRWAS